MPAALVSFSSQLRSPRLGPACPVSGSLLHHTSQLRFRLYCVPPNTLHFSVWLSHHSVAPQGQRPLLCSSLLCPQHPENGLAGGRRSPRLCCLKEEPFLSKAQETERDDVAPSAELCPEPRVLMARLKCFLCQDVKVQAQLPL